MEAKDLQSIKAEACKAVSEVTKELQAISLQIHAKPELCYEEVFAHQLLTEFLEKKGFHVEKSYKLKTAFKATAGTGKPVIAVMSEYDALPGIGHACGHNLIAVSALATGYALKMVLEKYKGSGTVIILGTPAEEGGGGKIDLLNAGALEDVDAAMMVHPCPLDFTYFTSLALHQIDVTYSGKNAHAAAAPWEGINALDAVVSAYNSISCLRQQLKQTDRVHGVITDGGKKPNIIPDKCSAQYYVRAKNKADLESLKEKVLNCFKSAALSTGCTLDYKWSGPMYLDVSTNDVMADSYLENVATFGIKMPPKEEQKRYPSGSTDMGNISYVVPSIHPMYRIPTQVGSMNHTPDEAFECTWKASKGMAMTAIDLYFKPDVLQQAKKRHAEVHPKL